MSEEYDARIVREHKEQHEACVRLYTEVATLLPGWTFEQRQGEKVWYGVHFEYKLVRVDGARIGLSRSKGRINVSGYWPHRAAGQWSNTSPRDVRESVPDISVAESRGVPALVNEIQKRFLPEYDRIYAKLQAKLVAEQEYESRREVNWQRVVATGAVVGVQRRDGEQWGSVRVGTAQPDGTSNYDLGYGDVRMTGENSVGLTLKSLPVETAIRILEMVRGD